jgi:gamma-glutamyltranspeptidase/glutathione hydrolase
MKRLLVLLLLLAVPLYAAEPVRAQHAMVSSVTEAASKIGADVMKKGGNAVDAAVAVALALAVTWPEAGNLGGGGFMMIRTADGKAVAIDYRERAPLAASRNMYLDASGNVIPGASTEGRKAVGVPGTIAGLVLAHKKYGKLKWAELVEPARKLAADGFVVNEYLARSLTSKAANKKLHLFPESYRIFQRDGKPYVAGETFVQPELAATLARIEKDPSDFYRGQTAKKIVAEMSGEGGLLTLEDLRSYEPTMREPLRGTYRGVEIITMPPPSSGGIALIEMLNMFEAYEPKMMPWHSTAHMHLMVEIMRRAFADRATYLGDADFVQIPLSTLLHKTWDLSRLRDFERAKATPSTVEKPGYINGYESPQTTHFTIVDQEGNAVSNTYTLNDSFGSGVTVKGAGFLINDEMDDFAAKPGTPNFYKLVQGEANAIAPRKRPLSSMTPTFVVRNGKLWFAVGSPGGPTIINTVFEIVSDVVDYGMNIQQAIDAPRFHHQWLPDEIVWEQGVVGDEIRALLESYGHRFKEKPESIGDAQGVMIDPKDGARLGGADHRRGGVAVGW